METMDPKEKTCGFCVICCGTEPVPSINKRAHSRCPELNKEEYGCGIYTTRPAECRAFNCFWLTSNLPKQFRPEKSDLLLMPVTDKGVITVKELKRGALRFKPNKDMLEHLKTEGYTLSIFRRTDVIREFEV